MDKYIRYIYLVLLVKDKGMREIFGLPAKLMFIDDKSPIRFNKK